MLDLAVLVVVVVLVVLVQALVVVVVAVAEDVSLVVDYNEFQESLSGKCRVKLAAPRDGVIVYEVDPPYVECIVVEK